MFAPVVLVLAGRLGILDYFKGESVTRYGDWFMFDLGLSLKNITLEAHSRGLGTVIVGYFDQEKVARLLDVPDDVSIFTMTPLGYPDEEPCPLIL